MSYTLGKNLHRCFSIIKRPQHQTLTNSPLHNSNNHTQCNSSKSSSSTLSSQCCDTTYTKNYNSLFEDVTLFPPTITTTTTTNTAAMAPASPSSMSEDTEMADAEGPTTPDLTAAYASRRFFISSPGRSNSIVDSLASSTSSPEDDNYNDNENSNGNGNGNNNSPAVMDGVAVQTYSPDPYLDFRQSMQEMVEARELSRASVKESWQYLQELLLSYLSLNPKNTHKYIVRAFADLVVSKMSLPKINDNDNNDEASSSSLLSSSFSSSYNCSDDNGEYVDILN